MYSFMMSTTSSQGFEVVLASQDGFSEDLMRLFLEITPLPSLPFRLKIFTPPFCQPTSLPLTPLLSIIFPSPFEENLSMCFLRRRFCVARCAQEDFLNYAMGPWLLLRETSLLELNLKVPMVCTDCYETFRTYSSICCYLSSQRGCFFIFYTAYSPLNTQSNTTYAPFAPTKHFFFSLSSHAHLSCYLSIKPTSSLMDCEILGSRYLLCYILFI